MNVPELSDYKAYKRYLKIDLLRSMMSNYRIYIIDVYNKSPLLRFDEILVDVDLKYLSPYFPDKVGAYIIRLAQGYSSIVSWILLARNYTKELRREYILRSYDTYEYVIRHEKEVTE